MLIDKSLSGRYIRTHQHRCDITCHASVLDLNLFQKTCLRIECRLPKLFGIHLAESLITLQSEASRVGLSIFFQSGVIIQIFFFAFFGHRLVKRRHGKIHMTFKNKLRHKTIEQGQKQCGNMRTVHIGICHNDDLVVSQLTDIKIISIAF